ncbi:hypothetical protein LT330_005117 [Penicillium expansum]|nr:hypothetical protein LT330_005117 [Penicillium expansum]
MAENSKSKEPEPTENIIIAADHGRLDLVKALLEGGADPDTVDEIGTSALHNAAKNGHWDIARLLLEKNASPGIEDGNRATPLRLAVRAGQKEIVSLLLECDPPTSETREIEMHSHVLICAAVGHAEILKLLLDYNAPTLSAARQETALHLAAARGYHEVCEILLKHEKTLIRSFWNRMVGPSLEVFAKDYAGNFPFAHAVERGHAQTVEVFLRHYPELGKTCDRHKELLFHRAVRARNIEMVGIFLNHGTDIELRDHHGRRALHVAIISEYMRHIESPDMIKFLLEHGALVDAKDNGGFTPESYSNNPKNRMILRNHASTHSKGNSTPIAPIASAPPPEYKA